MFSVLSAWFVLAIGNGIYCSRLLDVRGTPTVLAVENEDLMMSCEDDVPMSYCGFTHPNGTRYSFAGANLNSGQCLVSLKVMKEDSGRWTCHIGRKDATGEEITKIKNVRVGDKLAAVEPNMTVNHGSDVTLACTTSQMMQPLSYCRFVPPAGKPFSLNSDVTRNNSIKGRYYFPANKSLDRGDCAVTIRQVKYEDSGEWVCGAWLEDESKEFVDVIDLSVEGLYTISSASVTAIIFGVITLVILLSVTIFIAWKRYEHNGEEVSREDVEMPEMRPLRRSASPQRSGTPQPNIPQINIMSPSDGSSASPQVEESSSVLPRVEDTED